MPTIVSVKAQLADCRERMANALNEGLLDSYDFNLELTDKLLDELSSLLAERDIGIRISQ